MTGSEGQGTGAEGRGGEGGGGVGPTGGGVGGTATKSVALIIFLPPNRAIN